MKIKLFHITLMSIFLSLSAFPQEFRSSISGSVDISKKFSGEIEIELRKAFYPESYSGQVFQGKVNYDFHKRWRLAALYNFSNHTEKNDESHESGDETHDRHKFAADLIYQPKRFENELRLTNRFRYQYTSVDNKKPKEYLRNKITLDYKLAAYMNPYIALEPYYSIPKKSIPVVRFYLGNEMPVWASTLEMYYIAEINLREDTYYVQYILGITLKLNYPLAK